jgi:MerR family transcriptional regulator, activator of bmr gene
MIEILYATIWLGGDSMKSGNRYSIGHTANICNTSIQTLRYYDRIGLLLPALVDEANGYRYYTEQEILNIKVIQDLRELDFSIDEIRNMLVSQDTTQVLRMLEEKKCHLLDKANKFQKMAEIIGRRIDTFTLNKLSKDHQATGLYFELKHILPRTVAFTRHLSSCSLDGFILRFSELMNQTKMLALEVEGPLTAVYHADIMTLDPSYTDIEVCMTLSDKHKQMEHPMIRVIPSGLYLTALYFGLGNMSKCTPIYQSMLEWMVEKAYIPKGPVLEVFHISPREIRRDDYYVTELQIPIQQDLANR